MPALTKPRSLSKTLGIAAISLLAAGFITALGFGLRGFLWEMTKARADLIAAQASMDMAKAQMLKAINDLEAARLNAGATVAAAQLQSQATVEGARQMKEGTIGAAQLSNMSEISTTQNILNPYLSDPAGNLAKIRAQVTTLDFELTNDTNINTGKPLTPEERAARTELLAKTKLQYQHAEEQIQNTAKAGMSIFGAYATGMMELIKTGMKKNPGEAPLPSVSDPVEYKRRSFSKEPKLDPQPTQQQTPPTVQQTPPPAPTQQTTTTPRINPEPFDATPPPTSAPKPSELGGWRAFRSPQPTQQQAAPASNWRRFGQQQPQQTEKPSDPNKKYPEP